MATTSRLRGRTARRGGDAYPVPVLRARSGATTAHRVLRHPVAAFLAAALAGFALLVALSVALGLLVTDVLVGPLGLGGPDLDVPQWLARHRSGTLTDVSAVGSQVGGGIVLPAVAGVVAIAAAIARRWRVAAFAVFALAIESATYRLTSVIVPRERPSVPRLEDLPADASYPSGHTAAAIAVYGGLVLLLTSRFRSRPLRVAAWSFAVLVPAFVALSRMYRGMHHPLDVAGGMAVGIGAVVVVLLACRAAAPGRSEPLGADRQAAR
jgi:membrane-associated phospholipid phosphatase